MGSEPSKPTGNSGNDDSAATAFLKIGLPFIGGFLAVIALSVTGAWIAWLISGTEAGAWIGAGMGFAAGLGCLNLWIQRTLVERGCILVIVLVIEVILLLAWLNETSPANS